MERVTLFAKWRWEWEIKVKISSQNLFLIWTSTHSEPSVLALRLPTSPHPDVILLLYAKLMLKSHREERGISIWMLQMSRSLCWGFAERRRLPWTGHFEMSILIYFTAVWGWFASTPSIHSHLMHNWYDCHLPDYNNGVPKGAERNDSWHLKLLSEIKISSELPP